MIKYTISSIFGLIEPKVGLYTPGSAANSKPFCMILQFCSLKLEAAIVERNLLRGIVVSLCRVFEPLLQNRPSSEIVDRINTEMPDSDLDDDFSKCDSE